MNDFFIPLIAVISVLSVAVALLSLPLTAPAGVILGARVPRNRATDPEVKAAVRSYQLAVSAGTVLLTLAAVLKPYSLVVLAGAPLMLLLLAGVAYVRGHHRIARAKQQGGWFDGVTTSITGRISGEDEPPLRVPWPAYVTSLAILAGVALYITSRWADIPEVFPTHFGANLEPDAWSEKTVGNVYFLLFMALGHTLFMAGLSWLIARAPIHTRSDRTAAGKHNTRAVLAESLTGLGAVTIVLALGLSMLQLSSILGDFGSHRGGILAAFIVSVLGSCAVLVVRTQAAQTRAGAAASEDESPDNDSDYVWGMFYYNPQDPAVVVDKRTGAGISFNFATWQGKLAAALTILTLMVSLALPFVL
ncbi:DUF1648 domain-containing protein [Corynebacterium mayonis]|uniref:DUF1648 domain-containing protein n=1 Tax=Corynebacterium mayonis TaxID=3062461 RepID=UPI00314019A9